MENKCYAKRVLTLHCNAVKAILTKKGDLKGHGTVWYQPEGIANILSLNNIQKKYKVTYDSSVNTGFIVHKTDGTNHVFTHSKKGLFFSDVNGDTDHVLVNTVDKNMSKYTVKQYSDAIKAQLVQNIIGRHSTDDYINYVQRDLILNCPIIKANILRTEAQI